MSVNAKDANSSAAAGPVGPNFGKISGLTTGLGGAGRGRLIKKLITEQKLARARVAVAPDPTTTTSKIAPHDFQKAIPLPSIPARVSIAAATTQIKTELHNQVQDAIPSTSIPAATKTPSKTATLEKIKPHSAQKAIPLPGIPARAIIAPATTPIKTPPLEIEPQNAQNDIVVPSTSTSTCIDAAPTINIAPISTTTNEIVPHDYQKAIPLPGIPARAIIVPATTQIKIATLEIAPHDYQVQKAIPLPGIPTRAIIAPATTQIKTATLETELHSAQNDIVIPARAFIDAAPTINIAPITTITLEIAPHDAQDVIPSKSIPACAIIAAATTQIKTATLEIEPQNALDNIVLQSASIPLPRSLLSDISSSESEDEDLSKIGNNHYGRGPLSRLSLAELQGRKDKLQILIAKLKEEVSAKIEAHTAKLEFFMKDENWQTLPSNYSLK